MDLLPLTSLTMQRANEVACATDPDIAAYIQDHDIQLITYDEL